jgi:NAD+ diphosphatase
MTDQSRNRSDRSALTGFAINPLDRQSDRREQADFITALRAAETTRHLVLASDIPVLKRVGDAHDPLFAEAEVAALGAAAEVAYLGTQGGMALFATVIEVETPEPAQARDDIVKIDLRSVANQGLVTPEILGAFGQAKSLMYWHSRHRFCPNCGTPTKVTCSGWRRECDSCASHHFPRVDPVVIMLVTRGESCLLGRQARFPQGMYSCLAGFVEPGETFEDAVRREVGEEAGIAVGRVDYLACQPWPFPSSLMIGCIAEALEAELTVDSGELEHARWFSRSEVAAMLRKTHPDGLSCPPKLAIANTLMRAWMLDEAAAP